MNESENYFDGRAETWDTPARIELAQAVGEAVLRQVPLTKKMDVLDYGAGTGLLSLYLLPYVRSVTAMDSSSAMVEVIRKKSVAAQLPQLKPLRHDLEQDGLFAQQFDLIVSAMVLHHIMDTEGVIHQLRQMISPGGYCCLIDLDQEGGIFHSEEAAKTVFHFGFDRHELGRIVEKAGFELLSIVTAHTIKKPISGKGEHNFPVFLITGEKT